MPVQFAQEIPIVDEFQFMGSEIPLNNFEVIPSIFIDAIEKGWKLELYPEEIKDSELLRLVEKSEAFSFLARESENIYFLGDGTPIDEK